MVAELVSYALSQAGQAVVAKAQFVDLGLVLRDEPCDVRCPRSYAAAVSRAQRVSVDFRFRSGSDQADSRAVRDLERVVSLLHEVPGSRLLLLGFSDSVGGAKINTKLSLDRAQAIARELASRGVQAHVVKGFGPTMSVASNASEVGRQRNRRVEVWVER
jgi:phosphate transport system substrate-binding protein